jgi:hypothetical protein
VARPSDRAGTDERFALTQVAPAAAVQHPLIVRLLLDGQDAFTQLVERVPDASRTPAQGLNDPAWVIAHASFFHDCWLNGDARGLAREHWDPWLVAWADTQRAARPEVITPRFDDARDAWHRIVPRATAFLSGLGEEDLDVVPPYEAGAWPDGTNVGYLVARAVGHLFAHASELNVIATSSGLPDAGLPGPMGHTRSFPG